MRPVSPVSSSLRLALLASGLCLGLSGCPLSKRGGPSSSQSASTASQTDAATPAGTETLAGATSMPRQVPTSQQIFNLPEAVNEMRGQYEWYNSLYPDTYHNRGDQSRGKWAGASVNYRRWNWAEIQPRRPSGNDDGIDYAVIDQAIAQAAARGERFAFRVMPVNSAEKSLPDWLVKDSNAWVYHHTPNANNDGENADYYMTIPDWDSPTYLSALELMVQHLAARYDGDDRLAFVDVMGYGNWGEWHNWPWRQRPISAASARRIVDIHANAFRKTPMVQLTGQPDALAHVLNDYPRIGLRTDCFGDDVGGAAYLNLAVQGDAAFRHWKTAPFVTEWCQYPISAGYSEGAVNSDPRFAFMKPDVHQDLYNNGTRQVRMWHISLISGGNFIGADGKWGPDSNGFWMSDAQWGDFQKTAKFSGYRYHVRAANGAPASARRGTTVSIPLEWRNYGVAPTYVHWNAYIQVRDAKGNLVAEQPSDVKLENLASDAGSNSDGYPGIAMTTTRETFQVPSNFPAGNYTLSVQVRMPKPIKPGATTLMPDSYYQPMVLVGDALQNTRQLVVWNISVR